MRMLPSMLATLFLLSAVHASSEARAAAGDLDASFGDGGIAQTSIGTGAIALDVAVQTDGKIVAVGRANVGSVDYALARYLPDGTLDDTFGEDGIVSTPISSFGARTDIATGVALQSDGKIVVVGSSFQGPNGYDFAVTRYLAEGELDPSFDGDGIVITTVGTGEDRAFAVALQADGKIVVVGHSDRGTFTGTHVAVLRYLSDGSLDPDFGDDGVVITVTGGASGLQAVEITHDGKIVGAGSSGLVARYLEDGSLDASFSDDGILADPLTPEGSSTTGLAVGADGAIAISATAITEGSHDFAAARYTAQGIRDNGFDGDGAVITPLSATFDESSDVALQNDGKLVSVGYAAGENPVSRLALVRYASNGTPDPDFGSSGIVVTPLPEGGVANAVTLEEGGAIVVAGYALRNGSSDFVVARYLAEGPCPAAPRTDCRTASLSTVLVKDTPGDDPRDQLVWKWSRGQSLAGTDFGNPLDSTDYTLCLYSEAGRTQADIPAGPLWRDLGAKGFSYRDPTASAGGISEISLRPSAKNKSRVIVKGRGTSLVDLALPLAPADPILVVQLVSSSTGACMSSSFAASDVSTNQTGKLKAKAR